MGIAARTPQPKETPQIHTLRASYHEPVRTSLPQMSRESPLMCGPKILLTEWPTLMSQNCTVLSHPPVRSTLIFIRYVLLTFVGLMVGDRAGRLSVPSVVLGRMFWAKNRLLVFLARSMLARLIQSQTT